MTKPTLYDFALIKFSDMETTPAFTTLCGIVGVQVNQSVESQDRRVRDCATPALPGDLDSTIVGTTWTISGTGRTNADQRVVIQTDLLGKKVDYKVEYYKYDGTNTGDLIGTDAGLAIMEALNINTDPDSGTSDMEINLKGQGALTYTAAP